MSAVQVAVVISTGEDIESKQMRRAEVLVEEVLAVVGVGLAVEAFLRTAPPVVGIGNTIAPAHSQLAPPISPTASPQHNKTNQADKALGSRHCQASRTTPTTMMTITIMAGVTTGVAATGEVVPIRRG